MAWPLLYDMIEHECSGNVAAQVRVLYCRGEKMEFVRLTSFFPCRRVPKNMSAAETYKLIIPVPVANY